MKKLLFLLAAAMLILTACGETEEEKKEVSNVEKQSDTNESNGKEEKEEEAEAEVKEESYDEVLVDSEVAKVTLENISKVKDELFDEEYHSVKLAIENKSDKTIVIQSDEVSIDGLMVTDHVVFSESVSGGKKANGELKIEVYDGDLPPLDEELEMILLVIDNETYDRIIEEKINISIK